MPTSVTQRRTSDRLDRLFAGDDNLASKENNLWHGVARQKFISAIEQVLDSGSNYPPLACCR